MKTNKHEFSFYTPNLTRSLTGKRVGDSVVFTDVALAHRLSIVVRLKVGQVCVLFDEQQHARVTVSAASKKEFVCTLEQISDNTIHAPHITFFVPLLKRDALEHALYALVELGANEVQLVITEKVHRKWGGAKEFERLRRIMIAAAEQSGNYALPALHEPINFTQMLQHKSDTKLFFDVDGEPAFDSMQKVRAQKPKSMSLLVGPEADLSPQEKAALKEHGFQFVKLTPTVLRAYQALVVGLGVVRCLH